MSVDHTDSAQLPSMQTPSNSTATAPTREAAPTAVPTSEAPVAVPGQDLGHQGPSAVVPVMPEVPWGFSISLQPPLVGRTPTTARHPWKLAPALSYVPDTVLDATRFRELEVRAASVRGAEHRFSATPRQDAFGLAVSADGEWLVAVVCDGLGSRRFSHEGAQLVSAEVAATLVAALPPAGPLEAVMGIAIDRAATEVERLAANRNDTPDEFSCTITLAVVHRLSEGTYEHVVGFVGDSPAISLNRQEGLVSLTPDNTGGVHTTSTECLPRDKMALRTLPVGKLDPGSCLLLTTDGFGIPAIKTAARTHLQEAWSRPPGLLEFMSDVQFLVKSFDDDRTVVAIWAPPAAAVL